MADLEIPKGTTWAAQWPVLDDAGETVDVTGWTVVAQVRATKLAEDVLHEWSTEAVPANAEAGDGFVQLNVDFADSAAWTWSRGVYDVMLTSPEDERTLLDEGVVRARDTVTRDGD